MKLRFAVSIAAWYERTLEVSEDEWEAIKRTGPQRLSCAIGSPLVDYIDWNNIDIESMEFDEIEVVDEEGAVIEYYERCPPWLSEV